MTVTVTLGLDRPVDTYEGLRVQAKMLGIAGRGSMRKPQLLEAVSNAIAERNAGRRAQKEQAPTTITLAVNVDSVNASLKRIGRDDITVTPEDVRAAGMVPVNTRATEVAEALLTDDDDRITAMAAEEGISSTPAPTTITITPSPLMREVVSAILAEYPAETGSKPAPWRVGRQGRKAYPASKAVKRGKRGRK